MYGVDEFIAEADVIASGGYSEDTVREIRQRLGRLAEEHGPFDHEQLAALHGDAARATVLARGPRGSVLMLGRFPPDAPTPVHNHNSWGVVYVIAGRDRYERWLREDDGSDEDAAEVTRAEEFELGPGESVSFPPPPNDLHAQQGIGEAALELVFFAADPDRKPRAYFDPGAGTVAYERAVD